MLAHADSYVVVPQGKGGRIAAGTLSPNGVVAPSSTLVPSAPQKASRARPRRVAVRRARATWFAVQPTCPVLAQRRDQLEAVESGVPVSTAYELLVRAATQPTRVLTTAGTEERGFSAQRLRCKILRNDVEDGALALIFAIAALSFRDARPRGTSDVDYTERDDWTLEDLCRHLRFTRGTLHLDTDYVRGRMMKTSVTAWPTGLVEIRTINRHQMASRWIDLLKGKKHLRLVAGGSPPPRANPSAPTGPA